MTRDEVLEEAANALASEAVDDAFAMLNEGPAIVRKLKSKSPEAIRDTGTAFEEIHQALDTLKTHLDTGRRAQRERDELRRQLPQYDCCYTGGPVANVGGKHCPPEGPCLTCRLERAECNQDALRLQVGELKLALQGAQSEVAQLRWEARGSPMPGETPLGE